MGRHIDGSGPQIGQMYGSLHNSYTHGDFNCFQQKNNNEFQSCQMEEGNLN